MNRKLVEDFVYGLLDILNENHRLRKELAEAKEYERKYNELLDRNVKDASEGQRIMFEAILAGAFAEPKKEEK